MQNFTSSSVWIYIDANNLWTDSIDLISDRILIFYCWSGTEYQSICSDWDCQYASASSDFLERGYNINQGSLKNESHYPSLILAEGETENLIVSSNGRDNRDGCNTPQMDDMGVRMDLTDDLLHMVLIISLSFTYIEYLVYGCVLPVTTYPSLPPPFSDTVLHVDRSFLSWTISIFVKQPRYAGSGELPVLMKTSGESWTLRIGA